MVTMMAWSCDDTKVVTAVSDASLCVWDIIIVYFNDTKVVTVVSVSLLYFWDIVFI
jgi:hypothetical protein